MTATNKRIAMFLDCDLPRMASHCDQEACGYSLYRGVLVRWDEDHDDRVLDVIDEMPEDVRDKLLVVQEHEGSISFVWDSSVPDGYEENGPGVVARGDWWNVYASTGTDASVERTELTDEERQA